MNFRNLFVILFVGLILVLSGCCATTDRVVQPGQQPVSSGTTQTFPAVSKNASDIVFSGDDLPTEWGYSPLFIWKYGNAIDRNSIFGPYAAYYKVSNYSGFKSGALSDAKQQDLEIGSNVFVFDTKDSAKNYYDAFVNARKTERGYTQFDTNVGDESFGYYKMEEGSTEYRVVSIIVFRQSNAFVFVSYTQHDSQDAPSDSDISFVKGLANTLSTKMQ